MMTKTQNEKKWIFKNNNCSQKIRCINCCGKRGRLWPKEGQKLGGQKQGQKKGIYSLGFWLIYI